MTVVAAIVAALVYTILANIVFQRSAIYDPVKYAHPNDWFGLNFLFDIPLSLLFFVPLFIVIFLRFRSSRPRGFAMACGIILAALACWGFLHFYDPADRSLGDSASMILILCWGISSIGCAFLSQRLMAGFLIAGSARENGTLSSAQQAPLKSGEGSGDAAINV